MKIVSHTNPDGSTVSVCLGNYVRLGNNVSLGDGVSLGARVRLGDRVSLGNNVRLGDRVSLGEGVSLGNGVRLGNNVYLGNYVSLGDCVSLGDGVCLGNGVSLGNYVSLGDCVSLGDGVSLGDFAQGDESNVDKGDLAMTQTAKRTRRRKEIPIYLPHWKTGRPAPHYEDGCCTRCGRPINPAQICYLELDRRSGEYFEAGSVRLENSQGIFPFGLDCAAALIARAEGNQP